MRVLMSSYHNPNFINTTVYREKAVEYLGHELIPFDDRQFIIPGSIRERFNFLHTWDLKRINIKLVELAKQKMPDIVLVIGGQRILPQTILKIKELGIKIVLWTTDVPIDFENILRCSPLYHHVFCAGTEAVEIFEKKGLKNITWISFGCDPRYHKSVDLTEEDKNQYGKDVVFVGSYYPNRAKLLESLADFDIGIWGPYWSKIDEKSPLKSKAIESKINYDQWVKIYNAAKIVIVVHYQDLAGKIPCYQASPKLFEAMACGSFVLVDEQRDVKALFKEGEHLAYFKDAKDLREKVKYYLQHEDIRKSIAKKGQEEVTARHTFQHRMEEILNVTRPR